MKPVKFLLLVLLMTCGHVPDPKFAVGDEVMVTRGVYKTSQVCVVKKVHKVFIEYYSYYYTIVCPNFIGWDLFREENLTRVTE